MEPARSKDELERDLVKILKKLRATRDKNKRTELMQEAAALSVDLRQYFLTDEGHPDWAARTGRYREFMRECYSQAGYKRDEATPVQSSIRYHASKILRERLSPDEVASLGLIQDDQAQRMRDHRVKQTKLVETARALNFGGANDGVRAILAAKVTLEEITPGGVAALGAVTREQLRSVLTEISQHAALLADAAARGEGAE